MTEEWLKDLEPFETDWQKPFLEIAQKFSLEESYVMDLFSNLKLNKFISRVGPVFHLIL